MIYRYLGDETIYVPNETGEHTGHFRTLSHQNGYDDYSEDTDFEWNYGDPIESSGSVSSGFLANNSRIEELV